MSDTSQTYGGVKPLRTDPNTNRLRMMLQAAASDVEQCNRDNGWFDADRTVLEGHMLIVTEVAEMSEAWRVTGLDDATTAGSATPGSTLPKPEGYGSECADVLIRLLDQCTRDGVELAGEFTRKLEYNRTRGHHHGGKKL